jgi:hypothetical protein
MNRRSKSICAVFVLLAVAGAVIAVAQDASNPNMPPKVLVIGREYTKPGKSGVAHEKTESAFVQAMKRAKWPTHYLAVESLSGKSRALFLTGYDSFEEWERDQLAQQKNATLSADLARAWAGDGELLSDTDGGAFRFNADYSLRPEVDIAHMRYFEIARYQVKPGHEKDWDDGMKMVLAAYEKIPGTHWACYSAVYGSPDTTYIFFTPLKSGAEIDKEMGQGKDFESAMGPEGMKRLGELSAASIQESQSNLFAFNPRMSYPRDEWVKADPDYWSPKATAAPSAAKKPAAKPADSQ